MTSYRPLLVACLSIAAFAKADVKIAPIPADTVKPAVTEAAGFFDLADVQLLPSAFTTAMQRDREYLLRLEPDRLLHTFRLNVNLPSHAEPYGGWETPSVELRGHSLGHYLSACSLMYRSTGDAEIKQRIDYIVGELARCQAASAAAGFHAGYLSAFPESFLDRVDKRQDVWAPWYTLHKIMAGLLDANRLAGNQQALDILNAMAGWVKFRVDRLTPAQMQASLETEFGGMNEVLANLYAVTGNPDQLKTAKAFDHATVFDPLARGEDKLDGLHANTQIPKIIGAAREYELTGEARYRKIAETFWDRVALHRSYVNGGHSDQEHFFPVTDFAEHLSPETTETCNTYNMLKLTRHLWAWQPDAREMDFYERALYNHILASQDPTQGMFVYLLSLEPGHFKTYSTPENSFWCCVGTGMENHAKYGETIFARDDHALFVNLFIPAELNWADKGVRVRQDTRYPEAESTQLTWNCREPVKLALRIRHPEWATKGFTIYINGEQENISSAPGSYAEVTRTWKSGDRVEIKFPFSLHSEILPGTPDEVALLYGPLVLAGKLGTEGMPLPYARDQLDQAHLPDPPAPVLVATNDAWLGHVELIDRSPLLFRTRGLAQPGDIYLVPLKDLHNERYTVYWRLRNAADWEKQKATAGKFAQTWAQTLDAAIDIVNPADLNSEAAHASTVEKSAAGFIAGRGWRQAEKGGSFTYTLKTSGQAEAKLVCEYGGRDKHRKFDVFVDDIKVASPHLQDAGDEDYILETYPIPARALSNKQNVVVKFIAGTEWNEATANVFGVALVPGKATP